MYYAQINNGAVTGISQTHSAINAPNMVGIASFDAVKLGDLYSNGNFTTPVVVLVPEAKHITKLAFRNRFSQVEKMMIEFASLDDPTADEPVRLQKAALRATLKDQEAAKYIDLECIPTISGVQSLEAMGLLAEGRAEAILSAPVQEDERV